MNKKILIIDDSALMRRVISDIINADDRLTVADTASNGLQAIQLLSEEKTYDMILCDIMMPKMDGVAFLKELSKRDIHVPVLIVSSIAEKEGKETMEALELGAFDFVRKPERSVGSVFQEFGASIIQRVYCACGLTRQSMEETIREIKIDPKLTKKSKKPCSVRRGDNLLVIASSTGGPKALQSVVPLIPADFPYPVVLVQHMPKGFTGSLAARLNELSPLRVKEACDGEPLRPGTLYIAMGGKQCQLIQKRPGEYYISEKDAEARGGLKPCADIFYESLVNTSLDKIYSIVLTGMGSDATKGIQLLKQTKKVEVVAQDRESCVVYGMPRAAALAGIVDEMVPLTEITKTMLKRIGV